MGHRAVVCWGTFNSIFLFNYFLIFKNYFLFFYLITIFRLKSIIEVTCFSGYIQ